MAKVNKCDRCGAIYERNDNCVLNSYNGTEMTIVGASLRTLSGRDVNYMELCDECVKKLDDFMNAKPYIIGVDLSREDINKNSNFVCDKFIRDCEDRVIAPKDGE